MKKCQFCGSQMEDGDLFCPNCGKKVKTKNIVSDDSSKTSSNNGNLTVRWEGQWALVNKKIKININDNNIGEFSYKEGFETVVPITSRNLTISVNSAKEVVEVNPAENYTYQLVQENLGGRFGFILYDNNGIEIWRDKLHWGIQLLSVLLPIVGIIYGIVEWSKKPAASRTALSAALFGVIIGGMASYRIASHRSDMRQFIDDIKNRNNTTLVQDTDSIGEVLNETEDTSDADIKLIIDWYKYVLGGSPTENDMKRFLSSDVMKKIWTEDYEGCYMFWRFRTTAQDSKPDNDISEIEEINIEGGGWYTVKYKDMGWDGKTKVKVMDGKIVDFEKDVSWKSWDNEGVEDNTDNSVSED